MPSSCHRRTLVFHPKVADVAAYTNQPLPQPPEQLRPLFLQRRRANTIADQPRSIPNRRGLVTRPQERCRYGIGTKIAPICHISRRYTGWTEFQQRYRRNHPKPWPIHQSSGPASNRRRGSDRTLPQRLPPPSPGRRELQKNCRGGPSLMIPRSDRSIVTP